MKRLNLSPTASVRYKVIPFLILVTLIKLKLVKITFIFALWISIASSDWTVTRSHFQYFYFVSMRLIFNIRFSNNSKIISRHTHSKKERNWSTQLTTVWQTAQIKDYLKSILLLLLLVRLISGARIYNKWRMTKTKL